MQSPAYITGQLEAAESYGLEKEAWARAVMPLAGAAAGALLAPEGERMQGAALGLAAGTGLQAAGQWAGSKMRGAGAKPAAATPAAQAAPGPTKHVAQLTQQEVGQMPWRAQQAYDMHMVDRDFAQKARALAPADAQLAQLQIPQKPSQSFSNAPAQAPQQQAAPAKAPVRTPAWQQQASHGLEGMAAGIPGHGGEPEVTTSYVPPKNPRAAGLENMAQGYGMPFNKESALRRFKLGFDFGIGVNLPGTPLSVSMKEQRERLPGMDRWVPREDIERGFAYDDAGTSLDEIADEAARRGGVLHPAVGAALAAAGMKALRPTAGVVGPLAAGLLGAGLGAGYHQMTTDDRIDNALQGLQAARRTKQDEGGFPIRKHAIQTANESKPVVISGGRDE